MLKQRFHIHANWHKYFLPVFWLLVTAFFILGTTVFGYSNLKMDASHELAKGVNDSEHTMIANDSTYFMSSDYESENEKQVSNKEKVTGILQHISSGEGGGAGTPVVPPGKIVISACVVYNTPYRTNIPAQLTTIRVKRGNSTLWSDLTDIDGCFTTDFINKPSGNLVITLELMSRNAFIDVFDSLGFTHIVVSEEQTFSSDGYFNLGNFLSDTDVAAPFSVISTMMEGWVYAQKYFHLEPPFVSVRLSSWDVFDFSLESSLFTTIPNNRIIINSRSEYQDQWDEFVILHEYGHFVANAFYPDANPGGPHGGQDMTGECQNDSCSDTYTAQEALRLAWGEGVASFFATLVLHDAADDNVMYVDKTYTDNGTPITHEYAIETTFRDGADNEFAVVATLWDIYDSYNGVYENWGEHSNHDRIDRISLGIEPIIDVIKNYQVDGHSIFTIHDFYNGWYNCPTCNRRNHNERDGVDLIFYGLDTHQFSCTDTDGDGQRALPCARDCNDNNETIYRFAPEVCDGQDNNCDGVIDEGCRCRSGQTRNCGSNNIGACSVGREVCNNGVWGSCIGNINPATEGCERDSIDNDCDGIIDDLENNCEYRPYCADFSNDTAGTHQSTYIRRISQGSYCVNPWIIHDIDDDGYRERYMVLGEDNSQFVRVWERCRPETSFGYHVYDFEDGDGNSLQCTAGFEDLRKSRDYCGDGTAEFTYVDLNYSAPTNSIVVPAIRCVVDDPSRNWYGYNSHQLQTCWDNNASGVCDGGDHLEPVLIIRCGRDSDCQNGQYCQKLDIGNPLTYTCVNGCGDGVCNLGEICLADGDGEEICDGRDNNCNGRIDDDVPVACLSDADCLPDGCYEGGYRDYRCINATTCNSACVFDETKTDTDGDGFTVECGNDCNDDNANIHPNKAEICDGIDNDCSGVIDDNLVPPFCELQEGICANAIKSCGGAHGWFGCGPYEYGVDYEFVEESIDGVDNDCDAQIDVPGILVDTFTNGITHDEITFSQSGDSVKYIELPIDSEVLRGFIDFNGFGFPKTEIQETNIIGYNIITPPWEYCTIIPVETTSRFYIYFDVSYSFPNSIDPYAVIRVRDEKRNVLDEINDTNRDKMVLTNILLEAGREYGICLSDPSINTATKFSVNNSHDYYGIGIRVAREGPYFKLESLYGETSSSFETEAHGWGLDGNVQRDIGWASDGSWSLASLAFSGGEAVKPIDLTGINTLMFDVNIVGSPNLCRFRIGGEFTPYWIASSIGEQFDIEVDVSDKTGVENVKFGWVGVRNNGSSCEGYFDNFRTVVNYPLNSWLDIGTQDGIREWSVNGELRGNTVYLDALSDGSTETDLTFTSNQDQTIYLKIPKHAIVNDAKLKISGDYIDTQMVYGSQDNGVHISHISGDYTGVTINGELWDDYGWKMYDNDWDTYGNALPFIGPNEVMLEEEYTITNPSFDVFNIVVKWGGQAMACNNRNRGRVLEFYNYDTSSYDTVLNDSYTCPSCMVTQDFNINFSSNYIRANKIKVKTRIQEGVACHTGELKLYEVSLRYGINDPVYPTNPYLEVGVPDGIYEWSNTGEINQNTIITGDFSSTVNSYLANCAPDENNYCLVPIIFHSDTAGILRVSYIDVQYTGVSRTQDFFEKLNSVIPECTCTDCQIVDDSCKVPFTFHSDSAGILEYDDINIVYTIPHCSNGIYDGDEAGIDCGGSCPLACVDTDGDCLPDSLDACPFDADCDDDGLIDGGCGSEDLNNNGRVDAGETNPLNPDSDFDGIQDGTELGLTKPETLDTDLSKFVPDQDPTTTTDPRRPDSDGDGISDGQEDRNRNGVVDVGESSPIGSDHDSDGIQDGIDNCPAVANAKQTDIDGDMVGDACDNCVNVFNVSQDDSDTDGRGNACEDITPPELICPDNIITECASQNGQSVKIGLPWASDDSNMSPLVTDDRPEAFLFGKTFVTFTSSDSDGNTSSCTITVTVIDTVAPQLICPSDNTVMEGQPVVLEDPIVNDVCDATPQFSSNPPQEYRVGTTDVRWSASDMSGNIGWCEVHVTTVRDSDKDGVYDFQDNCPTIANPKQEDIDENGIGDVCEIPFLRGDANVDSFIDVSDSITILLHLFSGGELSCADAADVNDDGAVDISDSPYLLNYLFQGGPAPVAPFPKQGIDLTNDTLLCEAYNF